MADRIKLTISAATRHPFLIPRDVLQTLSKRVASGPLAKSASEMLASLDSLAAETLPDCPPGGLIEPTTAFYGIINPLIHGMTAAATAWWIEPDSARKTRWLAEASRRLDKLASWEFWRAPTHLPLPADLTTADTGAMVGLAYDILFDQLDPSLRRRVQDAILAKCTAFIAPEMIDRFWWSWAHDGNWSFVTNGGMGAASLAIHPERPAETLAAIETAAGHIQRSIDHIMPFGGWREGHGYAIYGFTNCQLFVDALANAGDARLADHPGLASLDDFYLMTMLTPSRQFCFGDNPGNGGGGPLLYRRAAATRRGDLQHFNDSQRHAGPLAMLWRDPGVIPTPPRFDPPSRVWPEIGWASMRSDWSNPDGVALAAKAGSVAGGHQHWDCGTFLLAAFGHELVTEPGIGHYSRDYHRGRPLIKTTAAHNTALFDGQEQPPREFFGGHITQFLTRPGYDALRLDLTHAYEHPDLRLFNRYFFLLRPGLVVIVDEVRARAGHNQYVGTKIESRLHTTCDITLRPFDTLFTRPGAALMVRNVLPPSTPGLGDQFAAHAIGEHGDLQPRSAPAGGEGKLRYLAISTDANLDPTVVVTVLLPARSVADADAAWSRVRTETRRRRRVEIGYENQTLILDWGNRRWQVYWNVLPGVAPELVQATVGGPGT